MTRANLTVGTCGTHRNSEMIQAAAIIVLAFAGVQEQLDRGSHITWNAQTMLGDEPLDYIYMYD